MIPFGVHTVTILHKTAGGYVRHVVSGCSWRMQLVKTLLDNARRTTLETTCRIPATAVKPCAGDLLILGEHACAASSEIEAVRLCEQLKLAGVSAFRATRVKDNANGAPMPHYVAIGE